MTHQRKSVLGRWSAGVAGALVLALAVPASQAPANAATQQAPSASPSTAEHLKQLAALGRTYQKKLAGQVGALSSGSQFLLTLGGMSDSQIDAMVAGGKPASKVAPPKASTTQPQLAIYANDINEPEDFITREGGSTQSETSAAWCGSNAVIGFNDSGSFAATSLGGSTTGVSFNGWAQSTNAGASYTDRGVLTAGTLPPDVFTRDLLGDPVLGCTTTTSFYYATLMTEFSTTATTSAIAVLPSTDGGTTFGPAVIAAGKDAGTHNLDKPWMSVAPGPTAAPSDDILSVTYTDFDFSFTGLCPTDERIAIEQVRSIDGGQTWSAPVVIDEVCGAAGFVQGSQVELGNSNDVYVAWERYPPASNTTRTALIRRSTDLGATFGPAVTVAPITPLGTAAIGSGNMQGNFRNFLDVQGLAVDRSGGPRRGTVYLTFQSGRDRQQGDPLAFCNNGQTYCFGDAYVTTSTDNGATWSSQVRINAGSQQFPIDHMFPAVDVDSTGAVWSTWYDRRRDPRNYLIDSFVGRSTDGGATWSNIQATPVNFAAIEGQDVFVNSVYMGDYNSVVADRLGFNPGVVLAWGDNALGDPNVAQRKQCP